jgi:GNAT superfamily N-acetyltransferase
VFELSDAIIDAIVFSMEDQDSSRLVNLDSGAVEAPSEEGDPDGFAPPPPWSSREGYKLMEDFLRTVRNPGARHELSAALNRGRGVFKAFKEVLATFPEVERAFHDYKYRAMRGVIRAWYDDIREAAGLARLGEAPDDTEDLIKGELGIETGPGGPMAATFGLLAVQAAEEAHGLLPEALVAWEAEHVAKLLSGEDWLGAWIEDGEGGAIACAAAIREPVGGRCFGRLFFIYVLPDFRRSGLGRALVSALHAAFRAEDCDILVVDSGFLPGGFAEALAVSGLKGLGCRGYFQP